MFKKAEPLAPQATENAAAEPVKETSADPAPVVAPQKAKRNKTSAKKAKKAKARRGIKRTERKKRAASASRSIRKGAAKRAGKSSDWEDPYK